MENAKRLPEVIGKGLKIISGIALSCAIASNSFGRANPILLPEPEAPIRIVPRPVPPLEPIPLFPASPPAVQPPPPSVPWWTMLRLVPLGPAIGFCLVVGAGLTLFPRCTAPRELDELPLQPKIVLPNTSGFYVYSKENGVVLRHFEGFRALAVINEVEKARIEEEEETEPADDEKEVEKEQEAVRSRFYEIIFQHVNPDYDELFRLREEWNRLEMKHARASQSRYDEGKFTADEAYYVQQFQQLYREKAFQTAREQLPKNLRDDVEQLMNMAKKGNARIARPIVNFYREDRNLLEFAQLARGYLELEGRD